MFDFLFFNSRSRNQFQRYAESRSAVTRSQFFTHVFLTTRYFRVETRLKSWKKCPLSKNNILSKKMSYIAASSKIILFNAVWYPQFLLTREIYTLKSRPFFHVTSHSGLCRSSFALQSPSYYRALYCTTRNVSKNDYIWLYFENRLNLDL